MYDACKCIQSISKSIKRYEICIKQMAGLCVNVIVMNEHTFIAFILLIILIIGVYRSRVMLS